MSVLTVTVNPALDVDLVVDALVPDHKIRALEHRREPGGGGVNVARVLQRLGVEVTCWVAVGGAIGSEYAALLTAEDLRTAVHRIDGLTRESVSIRDRSRDQQYRVVVDGPHIADVDGLVSSVTAAATDDGVESVVLSGSIPPGVPPVFYRDLVEELRAAVPGIRTIVDATGASLAAAVESGASLIKPSRRELASLVDWTPADRGEIDVAARQVLARGRVGAIAVSMGADGALLVRRGEPTLWYRAPEVSAVVSTVGSGDSMVAGIVAGRQLGEGIVDAVRRGVAAGTAAVMTPGSELCRPADVDRMLAAVEVAELA